MIHKEKTIQEAIKETSKDTSGSGFLTIKIENYKNLKQLVARPLEASIRIKEGFDPLVISDIKSMGLGNTEWLIPKRTLSHRLRKSEPLTPDESGRVYRFAKIYDLAESVFSSNEKAQLWLKKPRKSFDNLSALTLIETEAGADAVEERLQQINHGHFL